MKRGHQYLATGMLALALAACGGSGGSTGVKTPAPTTDDTIRVEAVLTNPNGDPDFVYQDTLNIQEGEQVTFQLVSYASGSRVVLPVTSFRTSDTLGLYGALSTASGKFTAGNRDSLDILSIVTASTPGGNYTAYYKVNPKQVFLRGRVLAEGSNAPVKDAVIDFYRVSNPVTNTGSPVPIGTVTTAADGTFRVSLPADNDNVTTAAQAAAAPRITFTIRPDKLPPGFERFFVYKGGRFGAGSTVCRATLSTPGVDPDTGETVDFPFKTGDRYLVNDSDPTNYAGNGTILLTPTGLFADPPAIDGCGI